ncbi:hypothetical protein BE73_07615 [Xanthomonas oryzae pv. oryzicola]|nr:hypothetical protein BE73_07615 [Xanthomonas oryzae pv. oryzicola]
MYRHPLLLALHRAVADLFSFSFCGADEQLPSAPLRTHFIEPCMTDDAKQPVLQRRFRPPLRAMTQRPFDRHLRQIVGIGRVAGNGACEAPKNLFTLS